MCGSASAYAKIALACIFVAFIMQIVAVATDYWMTAETTIDLVEVNIGLWKYKTCPQTSSCTSGSIPETYENAAFTATQALECIILIFIIGPFVLGFLYVFIEKFRDMTIATFICIMCMIIMALGIIAMVIWLTQLPDNYYANFSFGFAVLAFALVFMAAVLLIPDIRSFNERRSRRPMKVSPHNDHSYNRRYNQPSKFQDSNMRHYHNPNREPFRAKSPPPSYRTHAGGGGEKYTGTGIRQEIMSPDLYLGQRRY